VLAAFDAEAQDRFLQEGILVVFFVQECGSHRVFQFPYKYRTFIYEYETYFENSSIIFPNIRHRLKTREKRVIFAS
jgi:hypothetical protein